MRVGGWVLEGVTEIPMIWKFKDINEIASHDPI